MNLQEMLLTHLTEECSEVIQRVCKVNRFGMDEIEPNDDNMIFTNKQRLENEVHDILGVMYRLNELGIIAVDFADTRIFEKKEKIEKYLKYSEFLGTLQRG